MIFNYSEPTYYHFIVSKELHNDLFLSTTGGVRHIHQRATEVQTCGGARRSALEKM